MLAADKGRDSVVKLLLGNDRVDPNLANQRGSTALTMPLMKGTTQW